MKEINDLKGIERHLRTSRIFTLIYLIMTMIAFIMTLYKEEYLVLLVVVLGLAILFSIDLRYWNTKYYMLKMFHKLKK